MSGYRGGHGRTVDGELATKRLEHVQLQCQRQHEHQAADSFYQSIRAHNLGNLFAGLYDYSELILATWPQNIPSELPIEAFYYLPGGLPGAQHDQKDFFAKTGGKVVPIIKLALPTSATGDATFTYVAVDQAIQ